MADDLKPDEMVCDRAKLTSDGAYVRVDGAWIELLPALYRRLEQAYMQLEEILAGGGDVTAEQKIERIKEAFSTIRQPDYTSEDQ